MVSKFGNLAITQILNTKKDIEIKVEFYIF